MAHWKKTPKEMAELSGDDVEAMDYALALYEKRGVEQLSDLFGSLLGSSWSVESLLDESKPDPKAEQRFTWALRPERKKISFPVTLAVAPEAMKNLKAQAMAIRMQDREQPSVIDRPGDSFFKDAEIVDLSNMSKDEFLKFSGRAARIKDDGNK